MGLSEQLRVPGHMSSKGSCMMQFKINTRQPTGAKAVPQARAYLTSHPEHQLQIARVIQTACLIVYLNTFHFVPATNCAAQATTHYNRYYFT